jgi:hypothetical protein
LIILPRKMAINQPTIKTIKAAIRVGKNPIKLAQISFNESNKISIICLPRLGGASLIIIPSN